MLEIMSRKLDSKDDYFQHLVFYYYYLNSIQIEFVIKSERHILKAHMNEILIEVCFKDVS